MHLTGKTGFFSIFFLLLFSRHKTQAILMLSRMPTTPNLTGPLRRYRKPGERGFPTAAATGLALRADAFRSDGLSADRRHRRLSSIENSEGEFPTLESAGPAKSSRGLHTSGAAGKSSRVNEAGGGRRVLGADPLGSGIDAGGQGWKSWSEGAG